MKRKLALIGVVAWLAFGVAALATILGLKSDIAELTRVVPAIPMALGADAMGSQRTSGLMWDSAHGPPFLTLPGVLLVYFVPAIPVLVWLLRRRDQPASRRLPNEES